MPAKLIVKSTPPSVGENKPEPKQEAAPQGRTVVIWCDAGVKFFVVDGDLSHLHYKYIDGKNTPEKLSNEIFYLVHDKNDKKIDVGMRTEFPVEEVIKGAKVVVTGLLP
jgi:hypothetical protein